MNARIPPGSTVTPIPGGKRITYPPGERYEVQFVVKPDPRDARIAAQAMAYEALAQECVWTHERIAELEAAIYKLASGAIPVGGNFVEVLKDDWREMMKVVLAGTEPEPTATTFEELAI